MTAQAREEEEAKRDENFQGIHSLNIYRIRAQPHIYPNNPFPLSTSFGTSLPFIIPPLHTPCPTSSAVRIDFLVFLLVCRAYGDCFLGRAMPWAPLGIRPHCKKKVDRK